MKCKQSNLYFLPRLGNVFSHIYKCQSLFLQTLTCVTQYLVSDVMCSYLILWPWLSHSVSLSVTQCHSVSVSVTQCHSVSFSVTQCHSVSLSVTQCHSMSLSITQCHSMSLIVTVLLTRQRAVCSPISNGCLYRFVGMSLQSYNYPQTATSWDSVHPTNGGWNQILQLVESHGIIWRQVQPRLNVPERPSKLYNKINNFRVF